MLLNTGNMKIMKCATGRLWGTLVHLNKVGPLDNLLGITLEK